MLYKTPIVSVRWPEPGESIRLRTVDTCALWLRVHDAGRGSLPCVGETCPLCLDASRTPRVRWEGYLAGFDLSNIPAPLVLRLTPRVYHKCLKRLPAGTDLRRGQLLVERKRTAGIPQLAAVWVGEYTPDAPPPEPQNGCWPYLLRQWKFPGADPDYRSRVYRLWGLDAPKANAAFLRPDKDPFFPPEEPL